MSGSNLAPAGSDRPELWTVEEVADFFRISNRTLREWRELDPTFPLPLDLPGRTLRWYPQDVVDWALSLREVGLR